MPEITVPREDQPSVVRYALYTVAAWAVIGFLFAASTRQADSGAFALLALLVAGVAGVTVLFAMVESLVNAWFDAARVVDDEDATAGDADAE